MDWIKVKVSHVLYEYADLSDCEFKAWIRSMCLTAIMEKLPTMEELARHINQRTLNSLENKLKLHSTTLETIMKKVLEDVEYTRHLKAKNKSKIAEWRRKHSDCNQLPVTVTEPVTLPDKIREDKIREDKIREDKNNTYYRVFEGLWESYPVKDGKKLAYKHFQATVKTEKDIDDIKTALSNYLSSDRVIRGYVKNGSTWFNNWRDWVNYTEKSGYKPTQAQINTLASIKKMEVEGEERVAIECGKVSCDDVSTQAV